MAVPDQRVSDREREAVAERLRDAAAEGRLDAEELDERLTVAYRARTVSDLAPLTADLPPAPAPPPARRPIPQSPDVRRRLATFLTVNIICLVVWLATDPGGYFWPMWVILGTGIGLVSTWIRTALGVDDDEDRSQPSQHGRPGGA